jgi:hypothetical protein
MGMATDPDQKFVHLHFLEGLEPEDGMKPFIKLQGQNIFGKDWEP